ncbi:MAG TPA: VWA domain-containing protein [Candidatus Angelobacter sp.]|nr:VWA domain-containing protein [Candidatus Angelobacter sp.]
MDQKSKWFGYLAKLATVLVMCAAALAQSQANGAKPATQGQAGKQDNASSGDFQSPAVLKATTRLVIVDVVATDGKGVPIPGLTAKDFIVTENGSPQEVRVFSFESPETGPDAAMALTGQPVKFPDNVVSNIPDRKPRGALNVLLLDSLNTTSNNQASARRQMVKVLDKLPADRPIAIYMLGQKLQLLQDFTTDPVLLRNTVAELKSTNSAFLENPTGGPPPQYMGSIAAQTPFSGVERLLRFVGEANDAQTEQRTHATLEALNTLARTLAGYPGRKNLIWISEEFPIIIDPASTNFGDDVSRTSEALASSQVAVYTIDARGVAGNTFFKAETYQDQVGRQQFGRGLQQNMSTESAERVDAHSTMNNVAEITGGRAFYNVNEFDKAVRQSLDDGSTYYTLGYYPANKQWDGKFRKIKVKLDRPDARLRYRLGYFALDPTTYSNKDAAQRAQEFGQALNLDNPVSTALLFRAAIFPPSEKTHNKVALNYLVDAHQIIFEKQDDGLQHANLDYAVEIYSSKGDPIKTEVTSIAAALKPDAFAHVMQTGFPYQKTLDLQPGDYTLRLGVRDNRTGLIGTVTGKLNVPVQEANQKPVRQN